MKRAEQVAWAALAGLLAVVGILLAGGILYKFTGFWAGMMFAVGQGVAVALAAWGLMLARQASELHEPPVAGRSSGEGTADSPFRMSVDDESAPVVQLEGAREARTLDNTFQRLLVFLSGLVMVGLGVFSAWLAWSVYRWGAANPDQVVPVAGTYDKPLAALDALGLLIGAGAAGIYGIFWWITRPRRDREGFGEAVSSCFTLGLPAMVALAVGSLLGFFQVSYASEAAAAVIAALMILQGLELIANSLRSYSNIEEIDQEAIDLQALPLVPMLSSGWLGGLKMLFAQSVGLSQERESAGVIARLMPRALLAIVIIAIGISCIRVVPPGEVAVRERLGYAPYVKDTGRLDPSAILGPGIHPSMPWPIDQLVRIPTQRLQLTDVGTELHAPKDWKNVDFQFWTIRQSKENEENEDEFVTGDPGAPQLLETYIQVQWHVSNPALFYSSLSHSDFYEKGGAETKAVPIYVAMVQQCTAYAVTQAFAIHSLEDVMIKNRAEVETHCKKILQDKLDSLNSGIEVVYLTIKDLHPPFWRPDRDDATQPEIGGTRKQRGPASAFENVVSVREMKQMMINQAQSTANQQIALAKGTAAAEVANAQADRMKKVAAAQGDARRLVTMTEKITPQQAPFELGLLERHLMYQSMQDLFDPVNKIVVDPSVKDIQIYQGANGPPLRPPGG